MIKWLTSKIRNVIRSIRDWLVEPRSHETEMASIPSRRIEPKPDPIAAEYRNRSTRPQYAWKLFDAYIRGTVPNLNVLRGQLEFHKRLNLHHERPRCRR